MAVAGRRARALPAARRRERPAIPSADVPALAFAARRTAVLRAALALTLVGLLALSVWLARGLEVREGGFVAGSTSGIVVLDLSRSVRSGTYARIYRILREVAKVDQPIGLVVFSDTAYEAIPPASRGIELRPILRYFKERAEVTLTGRTLESEGEARYPPDPWSIAFRGGTRISEGIQLARKLLERERIEKGSALLISDLDAPSFDIAPLTRALVAYRREEIPLRVVPLFASAEKRRLFERILGDDVFVDRATFSKQALTRQEHSFASGAPWWLVGAAGVVAFLLAANERWFARVGLPRVRHGRRGP